MATDPTPKNAQNSRKAQEITQIDQLLINEFSGFAVVEAKRKKALKGSVVVTNNNGWLRLQWSWRGKRYFLSVGLPESQVNRAIAERKAKLIERDILTEQFDPTLEKYKTELLGKEELTAIAVFEQFTEFKRKQLDPVSIDKYLGLQGHIRQFFRNQKVDQISEEKCFQFRDWLAKKLAPITVKERLTLLRSAWHWGLKRKLVTSNPWLDVKIKVPPKQKPKPFSKQEIERILEGFRSDLEYSYYADVAEFMLAIGCRPGEAFGLKWKHLSDDCSVIWIGESWSRGRQKSTKTNKERAFTLSPRIQQLLLNRKSTGCKSEDRVFPSRRGKPMDDKNFCNRAWKTVLNKVGVPYRRPYNSRHSFVSNAAFKGIHPTDISKITGHSEETIYRHYLSSVSGQVQLPDLLE